MTHQDGDGFRVERRAAPAFQPDHRGQRLKRWKTQQQFRVAGCAAPGLPGAREGDFTRRVQAQLLEDGGLPAVPFPNKVDLREGVAIPPIEGLNTGRGTGEELSMGSVGACQIEIEGQQAALVLVEQCAEKQRGVLGAGAHQTGPHEFRLGAARHGDTVVRNGERAAEFGQEAGVLDDQVGETDGRNHRASGIGLHGGQARIHSGIAPVADENLGRTAGEFRDTFQEDAPGRTANQTGGLDGDRELEGAVGFDSRPHVELIDTQGGGEALADAVDGLVAGLGRKGVTARGELPPEQVQNALGGAPMAVGIHRDAHEGAIGTAFAELFQLADGGNERVDGWGGIHRLVFDAGFGCGDRAAILQEEIMVRGSLPNACYGGEGLHSSRHWSFACGWRTQVLGGDRVGKFGQGLLAEVGQPFGNHVVIRGVRMLREVGPHMGGGQFQFVAGFVDQTLNVLGARKVLVFIEGGQLVEASEGAIEIPQLVAGHRIQKVGFQESVFGVEPDKGLGCLGGGFPILEFGVRGG